MSTEEEIETLFVRSGKRSRELPHLRLRKWSEPFRELNVSSICSNLGIPVTAVVTGSESEYATVFPASPAQ